MIGLDTAVIVRFVTQDDPLQSAIANALFDTLSSETPGFVPAISLVESVWVLQRGYRLSRAGIATIVEAMLHSKELVLDRKPDIVLALSTYKSGSADFADCLIDQTARTAGCSKVFTLDRKAASSTGMELLTSAC